MRPELSLQEPTSESILERVGDDAGVARRDNLAVDLDLEEILRGVSGFPKIDLSTT